MTNILQAFIISKLWNNSKAWNYSLYNLSKTLHIFFSFFFCFFFSIPYLMSIYIINHCNKIRNSNQRRLEFKIFLTLSLHQFYYSLYKILSCLHSPFHAEVTQSVCVPNQITELRIILIIQKVSNCSQYLLETELARNKMNKHWSKHQKVVKYIFKKKHVDVLHL